MARKQETPVSTADVKDAVLSAVESGALATDSGPAKGEGQEPLTGEAGLSIEAIVSAASLTDDTKGPVTVSEGSDQAAPTASDGGNDADQPVGEVDLASNPNPVAVQIYPLRSYMDEGELRRRGGPAYAVPRRHAEELVRRKLASLEALKE
jgi:hypothetical protein